MARLIDANALWRKFESEPWYDNADRDEIALSLTDDAPTVDAVEVVRCKDCKRWERHTEVNRDYGGCRRYNSTMRYDDFCSYGERKDGDNNG